MFGSIQKWATRRTFPLEAAKLEVFAEDGDSDGRDLVGLANVTLRQLEQQIVTLQTAAERKHAVEASGHQQAPIGDQETRQLTKGLLPSLDALDRILDLGEPQASEDENFRNWLNSIKALRTRLTKTLEGIGLHAISSVGTPVDLEIHDVVAVVPANSQPVNTVVSEQQKGYYFRGKLLRDAKVVVAQ